MKTCKSYLTLLAFYPIIIYAIIGSFLNIDFYLSELLEIFFLSIFLYALILLIKNSLLKYIYLLFNYSLITFITFFELSFYYLYKGGFTTSTVFIILESNKSEITEYLSMYFDKYILILLFLLIIPMVANFFIFRNIILKNKFKIPTFKIKHNTSLVKKLNAFINLFNRKYSYRLIFGLTIFIIASLLVYRLRQYNLPFMLKGFYKYYNNELIKYDKHIGNKNSKYFTNVNYSNNKQTYIVIIGESTNHHHMSLYGYYRKTNPLLEKIKNELFIFDNIISPHAHTISSLSKALTLGNYENPKNKFNGSIIQLMNKAKFRTYWISNQEPINIKGRETLLTKITKACDKRYFMNVLKNISLDNKILDPLNKALSDSTDKKIIFIHLSGTHGFYYRRYPENFNKFKKKPKSIFNHKKAYNTINTYDNAILYNDYIVSNIIKMVKSKNTNSFVLYFSDHGEDVYDSIDMASHSETQGTKYMFDIPFILWLSDEYRKKNINTVKFNSYLHRKYMTDDLIYSIADLANVTFKNFIPERSIFNKKFKYRKRIIKQGDYDKE